MFYTARYITHPQVEIDSTKDVDKWGLNELGRSRVSKLLERINKTSILNQTKLIISSGETKAIETAKPIADAIGCNLQINENMGENDRSSTGFLEPSEFEDVADQFFAYPSKSIRGWERAIDAQTRIRNEVEKYLDLDLGGDILFIGHGAVGTLLYCALSHYEIDRKYDQGPGGGGNYFEFGITDRRVQSHSTHNTNWQPIEQLS